MHYLLTLIIPPALAYFGWHYLYSFKGYILLTMLSIGAMYMTAVVIAHVADQYHEYQHAQFDKDHDGVISVAEQSPEQDAAMEQLTNDTSRSMTVLFGIPWSIVVSVMFFGCTAIVRALLQRRSPQIHP